MAVLYNTKAVNFLGRSTHIVYQDVNGSCPLLALCNALLMKGDIVLKLEPGVTEVSQQQLILLAHKQFMSRTRVKRRTENIMDKKDSLEAVARLAKPININMKFTSVDGIASTPELELFEHVGVDVYHGFIIDPEDAKVAAALGSNTYDTINTGLGIYRSKKEINLHDKALDSPAGPTSPTSPKSGTSQLDDAHWELIDVFFKKNATKLTSYGLQCLKERLKDKEICVLFWNEHFHTTLKYNGCLYLLQNDVGFSPTDIVWKMFDSVNNDGAFMTSNLNHTSLTDQSAMTNTSHIKTFDQHTSISMISKHKCLKKKCSSQFSSMVNCRRHAHLHSKDLAINTDFSKNRDDVAEFWDELTCVQAGEILSLRDMIIEGVHGSFVLRALELKLSKLVLPGGHVAMTLLDITNGSEKREKTSSNELFAALDKASEGTFLCTDVRACKEDIVFEGGIKGIIPHLSNVLACCSYMIERKLVEKWFQHRCAQGLEHEKRLLAEEERCKISETAKLDKSCLKRLEQKQKKQKKQKDVKDHTVQCVPESPPCCQQDGPDLSIEDADKIDNICSVFLKFLRGFTEGKDTAPFYEGVVKAMQHCGSLNMHVQFSHIEQHDKKLAADVRNNYDRVHNEMLQDVVRYLIEQKYGENEGKMLEEIKLIIHDVPSPDSNMSFEEFVSNNKLIKAFKIRPKKLIEVLKFGSKGRVNVLTYAGRKLARGYMGFIIMNHKANRCWGGDWDIADMEVRGDSFVISKEALKPLSADGMTEDFKKYIELLLPFYHTEEIKEYPLYFNELQADIMKVPDPMSEPDKLEKFQKYIAVHLAFMPPVSRSVLFCQLFKVSDSLRIDPEILYNPLDVRPHCMEDWRKLLCNTPLFQRVYHYRDRPTKIPNYFSESYWYLLKYARHFASHVLDYTKDNGVQEIQDIIITDLILAQRLAFHLAQMILFIVYLNNMDGPFCRTWQSFVASDDKAEPQDELEDGEKVEFEDEMDDSEKVDSEYEEVCFEDDWSEEI